MKKYINISRQIRPNKDYIFLLMGIDTYHWTNFVQILYNKQLYYTIIIIIFLSTLHDKTILIKHAYFFYLNNLYIL